MLEMDLHLRRGMLGGSVEDEDRSLKIGVEPTTAEAKDLTSLRRIQSATHVWAQLGKMNAVEAAILLAVV